MSPAPPNLLARAIVFCGRPLVLVCDGRCDLAWGNDRRPRISHSADPDDFTWVGDDDPMCSPGAPAPGDLSSEGDELKPSTAALANSDSSRMNKWCARQCERSRMRDPELPDMRSPRPNKSLGPERLRRLEADLEEAGREEVDHAWDVTLADGLDE